MSKLAQSLAKFNLSCPWEAEVPLAPLTTFQVGGPAEILARPRNETEVLELWRLARAEGWPVFVLGRGANILVGDRGVRGLVLSTRDWERFDFSRPGELRVSAGAEVSRTIEACRDRSLSSLEFLYAMPSSIGGALWMNARCYGGEVSERFLSARAADAEGRVFELDFQARDWDYKKSPLARPDWLILEGRFRVREAERSEIQAVMESNKADRTAKGHFTAPCAGSIFKNNHAFGAPSGALIDRAGLKGLSLGNAQVAPWHGNIIINKGQARASDLRDLIAEVRRRVQEELGFLLEEEVLYVGDF